MFFICSERLAKQQYSYSPVEVAGWGDLGNSGPSTTQLQGVQLNVITNDQCNDNYPYRITQSQICFLTPRKDTCTVCIVIYFVCGIQFLY